MEWGRIRHLLLPLFIVASPRRLLAEDCPSSVRNVRLSANSYRNTTGHWITKAAITRKSSRDVSDLWHDDRILSYYVDITRDSCGDDETLTTTFSVVVPPTRVGSDYKFFRNVGYYKLHTDKMTWEDARRTCAEEGAHLAVVNSEAEENAIWDVMRSQSEENFSAFIDSHVSSKEGEYITVFDDPLFPTIRVRFLKEDPNMCPFSPEGEDCVNNHTRRNMKLPFVCERSLYL